MISYQSSLFSLFSNRIFYKFLLLIFFSIALLTESASAADLVVGSSSSPQDVNLADLQFDNLAVGRNGYVTIGSPGNDWLANQIAPIANNGGVLGIYKRLGLEGNAAIILDPSTPAPAFPQAGNLEFMPKSLLVVNGKTAPYASLGAIYASTPHTVHVHDGAALMLTGVQAGRGYRVLGENITDVIQDGNGWSGELAMTDSHVLGVEKAPEETGLYKVVSIPAQDTYPSLDEEIGNIIGDSGELEGILDDDGLPVTVIGTDEAHVNSRHAGVRFLSRATSINYMGWDYDKVVTTLEAASRVAILAAVPQMLMAVTSAQTDAIKSRLGQSENPPAGVSHLPEKRQFAFWITPFFRAINGFDLHANNYTFDYSDKLGGLSLGCDLTVADHFRFGTALIMGGGYSESGGDLSQTINNMGFWGVGLYGGWFDNNFSIGIDATYAASSNSVTQDLPASLEMRNLTGELTARAISGGLNLEYNFNAANWKIIPHAGARVLYSHVDPYTIYSDGALMDGNAIDQTIWLFPAGITAKGNYETAGGWQISPMIDLTVTPAAGEIEARTKIFYTGTFRPATLYTQTRDYLTVAGKLGLQARHENLSFGINCMLEGGLRTSAEAVQATFCYEF